MECLVVDSLTVYADLECGEDTLLQCGSCGYKANQEIASTKLEEPEGSVLEMSEVATPGIKTIKDLAAFLGIQ